VGYFKAEELTYLETEVTSSAGTFMQIPLLLLLLRLRLLLRLLSLCP
jgi:hypothetical protein